MKLKLNRFESERSFRSLEDFARFADHQKELFACLADDHPNAFEWWGQTIAQNWAAAANTARATDATGEAVNGTLARNPVFEFDSSMARIALESSSADQRQAGRHVVNFLNSARNAVAGATLSMDTLDLRTNMLIALALDRQAGSGKKQVSVEHLLQDHQSRLNELLEADQVELTSQRSAFTKLFDDASARFDKINRIVTEAIETRKGEWTETHKSFVNDLQMNTAVELWNRRSNDHQVRYEEFRSLAMWFGGLGLLAVLAWILFGFIAVRWAMPDSAAGQVASFAAGSVAVFTTYVWGLRVLIRSMISEDHLSTDASARSALAHTYLALTKVEKASPEDRAIVLATLFAPVSDGLVKDDGMPTLSPTAIAAQMVTR